MNPPSSSRALLDEFLLPLLFSGEIASEVVLHGLLLAIGVAYMTLGPEAGAPSDDLVEQVKSILYRDQTTTGEAAAFCLGMIFSGQGVATPTAESLVTDLLSYAHETQHERVIRAISIAVALIACSQAEAMQPTITQMLADQDAIIRYGGAFAVGLAYAATASNVATSQLLSIACTDPSDDVRRASVTSLGFVMVGKAEQLPDLLDLLSESFNPNVRYGTSLALGIAFASTGSQDAMALITPMQKDASDFCRQGAYIAQSLIYQQRPDADQTRLQLATIIGGRHEGVLSKFGSILGQGILDAGGRNQRTYLLAASPSVPSIIWPRRLGVLGMALFCQYWYWFPLGLCYGLTLAPTGLLAVDVEGRAPRSLGLTMSASIHEALFAYPPSLKQEESKAPELVTSAVLSLATRSEKRQRQLKSKTPLAPDNTTALAPNSKEQRETAAVTTTTAAVKDVEMSVVPPEDSVTPKSSPPNETMEIPNLARVLPDQWLHITPTVATPFQPVNASSWKCSERVMLVRCVDGGEGAVSADSYLELKDPKINSNANAGAETKATSTIPAKGLVEGEPKKQQEEPEESQEDQEMSKEENAPTASQSEKEEPK